MGELVPERSMGALGTFCTHIDTGFEDDNDPGKPVSVEFIREIN
jgi:hypothetical protein